MDDLIESQGKPLKHSLKQLGVPYCEQAVRALISANLNYPLSFTPTVFSYYNYFSRFLNELSNSNQSPSIGHRVKFRDHRGILHNDAMITSIIGSNVSVCLTTLPPSLSLIGKNKTSQKVSINTGESKVVRGLDLSNFKRRKSIDVSYIFVSNPALEDTEVFVPVAMACWEICQP